MVMTHSIEELLPRQTPGAEMQIMGDSSAPMSCKTLRIIHISTQWSKMQRSVSGAHLMGRQNALDTDRLNGILPTVRSKPVQVQSPLNPRGEARQQPVALQARLSHLLRTASEFAWFVPYFS